MNRWWLIANLIFYTVATFLYWTASLNASFSLAGRRGRWVSGTAHFLTLLGFFLHLFYLGYLCFYQNRYPFIEKPGDLLGFLSGGVIFLFLWLLWRYRWEGIGSFFIPLGFILLILSLTVSGKSYLFLESMNHHPWLISTHLLFAAISLLFFLGSSLLGLVFLLHENRLRSKKWNALSESLPPLLLNEKMVLLWLRFGFMALTLVLMTGSLLIQQWHTALALDLLHIALALAAWSLYIFVLNRYQKGLHGRSILFLSFLGFVTLMGLFLWN